MDTHIHDFAHGVTEVLKDDPELRLDVEQELSSHIEDKKAALEADGKSEQESLDLALMAFGSATDVADGLLAANRRRMRLRAWVRLTARAVLVPMAVIVALVICSRSSRFGAAISMSDSMNTPDFPSGIPWDLSSQVALRHTFAHCRVLPLLPAYTACRQRVQFEFPLA